MSCRFSVKKYREAIALVDAMSGTASLHRTVEVEFLQGFYLQNTPRRIHTKHTPSTPLNNVARARFEEKVAMVADILHDDGTLWCHTRRGWRLISDADRIAEELCRHSELDVSASHVRAAQRGLVDVKPASTA